MSLYWLVAALTCFITSVALAVVGYVVPRLLPFTKALLASLIGVLLALGVAIVLIEGSSLTRLGRRGKIIKRTANSIISDAAFAISWDTLALGRMLGSVLPEQIDVDSEIQNQENKIQYPSWESSVSPVLRGVFELAKSVNATDIEYVDPVPPDDYKRTVLGTRDFVRGILKRLESNLDVHERLLELSEALDKLDHVITQCLYPINIREEENRFRSLGQLGIASIDFQESLNTIHGRL